LPSVRGEATGLCHRYVARPRCLGDIGLARGVRGRCLAGRGDMRQVTSARVLLARRLPCLQHTPWDSQWRPPLLPPLRCTPPPAWRQLGPMLNDATLLGMGEWHRCARQWARRCVWGAMAGNGSQRGCSGCLCRGQRCRTGGGGVNREVHTTHNYDRLRVRSRRRRTTVLAERISEADPATAVHWASAQRRVCVRRLASSLVGARSMQSVRSHTDTPRRREP